MIAETMVVLLLLASGAIVARAAGLTGWSVPAVGFALGVAIHAGVVGILAVSPMPTAPWLGLTLTVLASGGWWLRCLRAGEAVSLSIPGVAATIAGVIAAVGFLRSAHLVNLTPDSFRYLATAGLLDRGRLEEANPFLLESRLLSVPALHSAAGVGGESYLRSATPLLGLACVLVLAWLVRAGLAGRNHAPRPEVFAGLAAALLVTNNRFVFHAFYLNGHLALATWLLLVAGITWLVVLRAPSAREPSQVRRLIGLQALIIPATVLTRPEAGLLVGLVLVPLLVSDAVPRQVRWIPLGVLGASMFTWQGFLSLQYRAANGRAPASVDGLLALSVVLLLAAAVLRRTGTDWLPRRTLGLTEGALWLTLAALVVADHRILTSSTYATLVNVLDEGGWGGSLLVLAALVVAVLLLTDAPGRVALRYPLTTFVPFSVLLAYLRDGTYRVGPGDSLSRSLLHVVPIAVLFVASAAASTRWGIDHRPRDRPVSAVPKERG